MEIDAPFTVSLVQQDDNDVHELHMSFSPEFQQLDVAS